METKIQELLKILINSKRILLINHIRMDMDAFGSLSALYGILENTGVTIKAINDELPIEGFSFLGYQGIIEPDLDLEKYNPDLIIALDSGKIDRLGNTYINNKKIFENTKFIVIDHHATNEGYGDLNFVNSEYSSTSEYLYDILTQLKLDNKITPKIATALLSGIYSDTNIFYNSNTTKNTYQVVGQLIEMGADFRLPYYELYKKKTFLQSKLWGEILANHFNISESKKYTWATVKRNIFDDIGISDRELEGLISEFFINVDGVKISFICYELVDGTIKVSLRSKPGFDISKIAGMFDGGGHKQAAGFVSKKSIEEVEKNIIQEIKKEFNF